ncbi:2-amino-4-hydroxy-6-hydroxymethyldihydropteridine diphosphokinase [Ureibacillus sinduriensis]|uniref:2-amino-4-hydroxy-6-hydroxymethyldihydropteridine diphosphokinase n=1 Tax=Ureibacillus sinduriensis BLB-1 = JCM 15800 TaxID=1384057 RepID=A0A0A3IRT8_9BACL|nr:2-amino-4-hydroxy-6-hydroxymethyldihydropteridine diphosphokinase [Ureibacillus sinduriensis]KGR77547.1 2-amino-4-hydroxy-6-hydroxymethyldihydropteridine pyrophosphokinase [Ureibacillus sinduriensis BLB-1 = JCM 15800]
MNNVYLSLGTNIGDREQNLKLAVRLLQDTENVSVTAVSSIYETAPVGYVDQPSFLNIALSIETTYSAMDMLRICQSVENELGRVREVRWGPRIIDLDILLYNNDNIEVKHLIVPHPRMFERAFVLVPLLEITKNIRTPHLEMAKSCLERMDLMAEGITKWKSINSMDEFL